MHCLVKKHMSRIGKKNILIPQGVTVAVNGANVEVKGLKGVLTIKVRPEIKVLVENGTVISNVVKETKESNAFWGTTNATILNAIRGVTEGFEKRLELVGVGYRAKMDGNNLSLTLGFSHPVVFEPAEGIKFAVPDQQNIIITGSDKQKVGLIAASIRKIRKPVPYKGKGIKYVNEVIRRKAGKSGKA